jgi:hypothetical protein
VSRRRLKQFPFDGSAVVLNLAVALLLLIPAVGMFFADDAERTSWEKRPLAEFPSLSHTKEKAYFAQLNDYLNDHFGFAVKLNRYYRKIVYYGFHDTPSDSITLGRDGFIFLARHGDSADKFNALERLCLDGTDSNRIEAATASREEIHSFLTARDYPVFIAIAPSKPTLYPDKLTMRVPRHLREACSDYKNRTSIATQLSSHPVLGKSVIYPIDDFFQHRHEGNFYPRENFHIDGDSSHLFAKNILTEMGLNPGPNYDGHRIQARINSDLSSLFGFRIKLTGSLYRYGDYRPRVHLQNPDMVKSYYSRASDFGTWTSKNPLTKRKLLVISDSFGSFAARHLAPGFSELTWININHLKKEEVKPFFQELLPGLQPDGILFLFHEGGLQRSVTLKNAFDFNG